MGNDQRQKEDRSKKRGFAMKIQTLPWLWKCLFVILIGFFSSCDRNNCSDVFCGENQQCIQGNCFCDNGFEGVGCSELAVLKYEGNYSISELCQAGFGSNVTFGQIYWDGFSPNRITLVNFLNRANVEAYIFTDGNNRGNVIEFSYNQGSTFQVNGRGTWQENLGSIADLTIDVEYYISGQYNACTLLYYKQ